MIQRVLAFGMVVVGIQGCGRTEPPQIGGIAVRATCPQSSSREFYFSPEALEQTGRAPRGFLQEWLSSDLLAVNEPSLSCGVGSTSYRLSWSPSLDPAVVVRVDIDSATKRGMLNAVELKRTGIQSPARELRRINRTLSEAELAKLQGDVRWADPWSLSSREPEVPGIDGSHWVIEARDNNRYHVVSRWYPEGDVVQSLGVKVLQLTGWQFEHVY